MKALPSATVPFVFTSILVAALASLAIVIVMRRRRRQSRAGGLGAFFALLALAAPLEPGSALSTADTWLLFVLGLTGVTLLAWNQQRGDSDE